MRYIVTLLIFLANQSFGQNMPQINYVTVNSKVLQQERNAFVYTPHSYNENTSERYDVIYVFDTQNRELFDYTHSVLSFINNSDTRFIVVGVTSPYNEKEDYSRNNDLLPEPVFEETKNKYGKYAGNANEFMLYVKSELIPFIEKSYNTTGNRIAIGHSNSAGFLIYTMASYPDLFTSNIAISPNFAYDRGLLVTGFQNIAFNAVKKNIFLYLSNATEEKSQGWEFWKPSRDTVYAYLLKNEKKFSKLHFVIEEFPSENHRSTFVPGVTNGLKAYFGFLAAQKAKLSKDQYNVTITVKVPNDADEAFITGNQQALGYWQPNKVKLDKISGRLRQIKLKVQTPTEFKITRGSWQTEAIVKGLPEGNNVSTDSKENSKFTFEVLNWIDKL